MMTIRNGGIAAVILLIGLFLGWLIFAGSNQTKVATAVDGSQKTTVTTDSKSSDDKVLAAWNTAVKTTPPIAGSNGWKPIEARATGEKGCTPGETRVNPKTGMLQGCR